MVEKKKIVIVKHPNCGTQYTFTVPEQVSLQCGDYVLCMTKKSNAEIARCISPSFEIIEPHLLEFYGLTFAQLKPVVGRLAPKMFLLDSEKESSYEQ